MLKVLLLITGVFAVVFLEHFLLRILSVSIYALLGIYLWDRIDKRIFLIFFVFLGLALDVTMHYPLGFHILALAIPVLFSWLAKTFVPVEGNIQEYSILFASTTLFYITLPLVQSLLLDSQLQALSLQILFFATLKALGSLVIYFLINISFDSLRGRSSEKIRLR